MLPTSGTYNFQSVQVEILIREAFERIGLLGDFVEPVKLNSARRSINLLLLEWMSKSINLWTLKSENLALIEGQHQYILPDIVSDIIQINLKTLIGGGDGGDGDGGAPVRERQLNGTAVSDRGGTAANAFDGNPATACTQTGIGGSIVYDFGVGETRQVTSVGIQSNVTGPLELSISVSDDGVGPYNDVLVIPERIYQLGENVIFDIPMPVDARFYSIGGDNAHILDIQELYYYVGGAGAIERVRQLGGVPSSDPVAAGGIAANAFDGNAATAFTQVVDFGGIFYDYGEGNTRQITAVGIQANATGPLTLGIAYSQLPLPAIFTALAIIPERIYTAGENVIFDIPIPVNARFYSVGGLVAGNLLNFQEVYFYTGSSGKIRQLGGTPFADQGAEASSPFAFDNNPNTACVQFGPDGIISYDYGEGETRTITSIGIMSNQARNYAVSVRTSNDGVDYTNVVLQVPDAPYRIGVNVIYDIANPVAARFIAVKPGATRVFNLKEIYFWTTEDGAVRQLGGGAFEEGGGIPANAFDGNPGTACTQTATDGIISYDYGDGVTRRITSVGIQSNTFRNYTINIVTSDDGVDFTNVVLAIGSRDYSTLANIIFDIPVPIDARFYGIQEIGGAVLDIQEIYFYIGVDGDNDGGGGAEEVASDLEYRMAPISRHEYFTYPNKDLEGRPSSYYLDRQVTGPVLNVWPTPTAQYNNLIYSYKKVMEDVGEYTNAVEIPSRFYPALVWGLSWHLAVKFKPELAEVLKGEYEQAFAMATEDDSERTAMTIRPTKSYYK